MQSYWTAFYLTATLEYIAPKNQRVVQYSEQADPFFGVPGTIDILIVVALFAEVFYGRRKPSSL